MNIQQLYKAFFILLMACSFKSLAAQQTDSLKNVSGFNDTVAHQNATQPSDERISFAEYFRLLNEDMQQDVLAPFHQSNKSWKRAGIYAASLTAFSFAFDEPVQIWASNLHNNNKAIAATSSFVTKFGGSYGLYSIGALGAYSYLFHNDKLQTTTLLATQAYITSGLLETALKYITGRQRPGYYNPRDDGPEPSFHGPAFSFGDNIYKKKVSTAFPSGHTTVAFAVATVFAKEYSNTPWVPVVAYGTASLVGLSRLTQNAHWATDVIAGAALGYLCGLQVVHNYHRYQNLKTQRDSGKLSFNLEYNGHNFQPGIIYTFRH